MYVHVHITFKKFHTDGVASDAQIHASTVEAPKDPYIYVSIIVSQYS